MYLQQAQHKYDANTAQIDKTSDDLSAFAGSLKNADVRLHVFVCAACVCVCVWVWVCVCLCACVICWVIKEECLLVGSWPLVLRCGRSGTAWCPC